MAIRAQIGFWVFLMAKKIVTQDYRKKIRNAEKNSFSPRLDDLDKEINDQSFNARFHNKVQKLLKNNRDKLMKIACSPNSVQEMETYIRDGIRNSNVLDQEASATAFLSNTVNLKKHAIRYIMEGEAKKKGPAAVKAENGVQKNAVKKEPPKPKGISV